MSEAQLVRCLIYALGHNYKGAAHALNCIAARGYGRQVALQIGGQAPTDEACVEAIDIVLNDLCDGCGAYRGHGGDCPLDVPRAAMRELVGDR